MNAHEIGNNARLRTVELELGNKIYNVATDLYVLSKIREIPDDTDELVMVMKLIKFLCNGAIKRENLENCTKNPLIDEEYVQLYIGLENIDYYKNKLEECGIQSFPDEEPELDDDGDEMVVTDEMRAEFGKTPEEKNVITE